MLKRLKWRFILLNMLLVGLAVAVMFGAACVLTYRSGRNEIDRALEKALRIGDQRGEPPAGERPEEDTGEPPLREDRGEENGDIRLPSIGDKDAISYVYTVTVVVKEDGSYLREDIFGAEIDGATLSQAVEKATASQSESGTLRALGLSWRRVSGEGGTVRIAFASTDHLSQTMRRTALISGAASLLGLLLFFGVSYLLAGVVIRPTAEAWEQQKRFVADASHDLKTPLTVILANTDILREQSERTVAEQMQWVNATAEEAEHMRSLVNEMLELARSEDRRVLPLSPLSVSDLCERTVLQFEPVAFERGVAIDAAIAPDVVIPAHEESFVRLLHILVDNAVKYSPRGETVRIALMPRGNGAELSVRNGGTPISPEDLPHLFERFYRADKARSMGGFGLGLSIAKRLTEAMKGRITVTSDEREGTVFTVRF